MIKKYNAYTEHVVEDEDGEFYKVEDIEKSINNTQIPGYIRITQPFDWENGWEDAVAQIKRELGIEC